MEISIEVFNAANHWASVQHLLARLDEAGLSPAIPGSEIERLLIRCGLVAIQGGRCLAAAAVHLAESAAEADLLFVVDPNASPKLQSEFLDAVSEKGRQLKAESLLCYLRGDDDTGLTALAAAGAAEVPGSSRWSAVLEEPLHTAAGDSLRIVETDDVNLLLIATKAAWNDLPGHKPATEAAALEAVKAFGPNSHSLALDVAGTPVGLVRSVLTADDEGYIDAPGLATTVRELKITLVWRPWP